MPIEKTVRLFILLVIFLLPQQSLWGYICNTDRFRELTVTVQERETVTEPGTPFDVEVLLKNESNRELELRISVGSIETVKVHGAATQTLSVPPGETTTSFQFLCEPETYSAHYPIHVLVTGKWDNEEFQLKPVQVIETRFPFTRSRKIAGETLSAQSVLIGDVVINSDQLPLNRPSKNGGGFLLSDSNAYRVLWKSDNQDPVTLPVGWQGSDETSAATFFKIPVDRGGETMEAFSIHPPWKHGPGTMFTEYLMELPRVKPLTFSFFGALRDTASLEPASDGVTYRVWVNDKIVGENHIASQTWTPVEFDLSDYAGKTVLLRLESDPGPKRDTTCDSAFWGTPLIYAGKKSEFLTPDDKQSLFKKNLAALKTGKSTDRNTLVLPLENGLIAVLTLGKCGFVDGVIGLGNAEAQVQYDGLKVTLRNQEIARWPSGLTWEPWKTKSDPSSKQMQYTQRVRSGGNAWNLTYTVKANGPALQLGIECDDPSAITNIAFGPTTQTAERVYFGHGYCIDKPRAFRVNADGHQLSTSHVGFDFEGGLSILMASTMPPKNLTVNTDRKIYTLETHPDSLMTLLPGTKNAMDCAIQYRAVCDKKPGPGVLNKAGRFVFDAWGGHADQQYEKIKEQIDYGLTDAIYIVHNWQRWGYDNRLPDIWPPNPKMGSVEQFRKVLALCRENGILYGLHDNYIDIYPDCDGFSYDMVSFTEQGIPRQAWNNVGIKAQSYQFRPDCILPFIERNFGMMIPELPQTTYFVDVFSSIELMDFRDRHGILHSRSETRDYWCKAFDLIRDKLGNNHPTISEAGNDFLIGHLDGSDCQFMLASNEPGIWRIYAPGQQAGRIPWFDMVNHTRFSLHGVGYDSRYAAERGYQLHGYMSDDYISAEVLTGHALQVGWGQIGRDSIRKYWFLQPLARQLADKEIISTEFVDDNILRLRILWSDGTLIHVNRDSEDWTLDVPARGKVAVPEFGFYVQNDKIGLETGLIRENGHVIEFSKSQEGFYYNPRNNVQNQALPILPLAGAFQMTGEKTFDIPVQWNVFRSLQNREELKNIAWYVGLEPKRRNWYDRLEFVPLTEKSPETPVREWKNLYQTETGSLAIPDDLPPGEYNLLVGLIDKDNGSRRLPLLGPSPSHSNVIIGTVTFERKEGKVANMIFKPETEDSPELFERLLPPQEGGGDWDGLSSDGAFRMQWAENRMILTPLLGEKISEIRIPLKRHNLAAVKNAKGFAQDGSEVAVDFRLDQKQLVLRTDPNIKDYVFDIGR